MLNKKIQEKPLVNISFLILFFPFIISLHPFYKVRNLIIRQCYHFTVFKGNTVKRKRLTWLTISTFPHALTTRDQFELVSCLMEDDFNLTYGARLLQIRNHIRKLLGLT